MAKVTTRIKINIANGEASVERTAQIGTKAFAQFDLAGTRYILNRQSTGTLLKQLNAMGDSVSTECKRVRKLLSMALSK